MHRSGLEVVNMEGSQYDRSTYGEQSAVLRTMGPYSANAIRYPSYHIGRNYLYYWLGTVFSQLTYGLAVDIVLRLTGEKPR